MNSNIESAALLKSPLLKWLASACLVVALLIGTFGFALYSAAEANTDTAADSVLNLAGLELTDQHGKRLKKSDLKDKLVMMNFFFTTCGSACPIQTQILRNVQENIDPSVDVLFISISIAPLLDTPAAIDEYLAKYDIRQDNWKFVTTSVENTRTLIERYAVTLDNAVVKKDQIDHRNMGYLFGKSGTLMQQYQLIPAMSERLVREINELSTFKPMI